MLYLIFNYLRDLLRPQRDLLLENLALRQQILVLERQVKRPRFKDRERAFWVLMSRFWPGWKNPLRLVQPQTVISWHRQSWRLFWRWKSKPKEYGRPNIPFEVIELIRQMSLDNPLWGAPHIHGELIMLGYDLSESTVAKYMIKRKGRPTQNWKTFLQNHLGEIAAIDFLTMPTVTFKTLYVFVVLSLDRRRVVHFHVTSHPTSEWTAMQLVQAFPFDSAPRYLIRDRDGIYGEKVQSSISFLGMKEKVISARSPWQNGYCERLVGTIKRECLNHMIVFNEAHARRVLKKFFEYYHDDRTHLGLEKDTPAGRIVEPPELGPVKRRPVVGGLHSRYYRKAA
jgi:transposase InsO family protein